MGESLVEFAKTDALTLVPLYSYVKKHVKKGSNGQRKHTFKKPRDAGFIFCKEISILSSITYLKSVPKIKKQNFTLLFREALLHIWHVIFQIQI